MGLRDKLVKRMMAGMPDYPQVFAEALGPDDRFLAYSSGYPSAYVRQSRSRGLDSLVINKVTDAIANKRAADKHIGGGDDSISRTLPRTGELAFVVLSEGGLSLWDLGMTGRDLPPTKTAEVARDQIASIAPTGESKRSTGIVIRVTFTDESFFDYQVTITPEEFLTAAASFA